MTQSATALRYTNYLKNLSEPPNIKEVSTIGGGAMNQIFTPVTDLVGSLHQVLHDAAVKVWDLVKPIFLIGVVFDLVTSQLGWIESMLGYYNQFMIYTSGASWLVVLLGAMMLLSFSRKS